MSYVSYIKGGGIVALTPKQQLFIKEYLVDLNGSAAMRRAGYKSKNPDVDASKLLVNPSIKKAIDEAVKERAEKTGITAEFVLNGIKAIATKGEKESDKLKAYELLGKHLKLFTDKIESENNNHNDGEINVNIKVID
jgi:phage terminase small subunit